MSIKYLGDNQLNQIQNNPNDTPWAKLIAQSEMLERNKMRQPQGQYPQGTVAGNIQQQLLNDQAQQFNQVQGLDADKARILAQLIGSGQLPGMAVGGQASLTNPQQAPMLGASAIKPQVPQTQLAPTKEAADQQPKHDIFQRLLDQSIVGAVQGKANIGDTLQLYADMFTGKALKGLAEGGDVRGFSGQTDGSFIEQLQRIKSQLAQGKTGWTPEAIANYKSAYNPSMAENMSRRGLTPTQGMPSYEDIMKAQARLRAQTGLDLGVPAEDVIRIPPYQERVTIPEAAAPQGLQTSANRGFGAAPQSGPMPEYIPAERPTIAGALPKEHKVFEGASFEHPRGTPRADAAFAQAEYADRVGPPRGAAMSSPEAQAYLRDPSFVGKATPASEYVGPQMGQEPPTPSVGLRGGNGVMSIAGKALGVLNTPSVIDMATGDVPDTKSAQEIKAAWEKGGVPEVFNYENAKASANLNKAKDWMAENVGRPLQKFWYGPNSGYDAVAGAVEGSPTQVQQPSPTSAPNTTAQTKPEIKQSVTKDNASQIAAVHGYTKQVSPLLDKAAQAAALDQTEQAITQTGGDDMAELLHKRLKDADVDYMELAKRISENEKDLAQERKDGTLTAMLAGVGAALSRAGTLEQKGDRVFTPGIGQILGSGILGGVEQSEASEKKYRLGVEKNLDALAALQGLKRATSNDLMDAYAAERQSKVNEAHFKANEQAERDKLNQYLIPSLKADEIRANASMLQATNRGGEDTANNKAIQRLNTQLDNITQMLNTEVTTNGSDSDRAKQLRIMQDTYVNKINQLQGVGGTIGGTIGGTVPAEQSWLERGFKKLSGKG